MDWQQSLRCRPIPLYMLAQWARMLTVAHAVIDSMGMDETQARAANHLASKAIIWGRR